MSTIVRTEYSVIREIFELEVTDELARKTTQVLQNLYSDFPTVTKQDIIDIYHDDGSETNSKMFKIFIKNKSNTLGIEYHAAQYIQEFLEDLVYDHLDTREFVRYENCSTTFEDTYEDRKKRDRSVDGYFYHRTIQPWEFKN